MHAISHTCRWRMGAGRVSHIASKRTTPPSPDWWGKGARANPIWRIPHMSREDGAASYILVLRLCMQAGCAASLCYTSFFYVVSYTMIHVPVLFHVFVLLLFMGITTSQSTSTCRERNGSPSRSQAYNACHLPHLSMEDGARWVSHIASRMANPAIPCRSRTGGPRKSYMSHPPCVEGGWGRPLIF